MTEAAGPPAGPPPGSPSRPPARPGGRGDRVWFRFDGRELTAPKGATVAAGLLANGVLALRTTRRGGRPRGLFCAIGNCFDCLVDVGGDAAERACRRVLAEGDDVRPATPASLAEAATRAADAATKAADAPGTPGTPPPGHRSAMPPARLPARLPARPPARPPRAVRDIQARLAVVGAGPAGMAAALAAADLGCDVVLVDAGPSLGGQVYRQPELPAGETLADTVTARLPRRFHRLATHPRVRRLHRTSVWAAEPLQDQDHGRAGQGLTGPGLTGREHGHGGHGAGGPADGGPAGGGHGGGGHGGRGRAAGGEAGGGGFRLYLDGPAGPARLDARAVVVATGAVELALPFPGWDLPGVVTAGAAQALLEGQGVVVGRRVVVAGSGPFLLPVAAGLAAAGARVLALCEAASPGPLGALPRRLARLARHPAKAREAAGYAAALLRHRVPLRLGHGVVACHGDGRVEAVTVARLDRAWRPVAGTEERIEVDAVCVGHGFVPDLALARALGCGDHPDRARPALAAAADRDQRATRPGVFVAGEVTGVAGAGVAELEGHLAGIAAARHLGLPGDPASARRAARAEAGARARLDRARGFTALLDDLYRIGPDWPAWLTPSTVVCRCEETTWAEVERAVAAGADDLRAVRGATRCGMGYCQGRVCGPPLRLAIAARGGRPLAEVGDFQARTIGLPVTLGTLADLGG